MSDTDELLISVTPTGRRVIAEVGDYELEEVEFTLEIASSRKSANIIEVSRQYLLPGTASKYISIKQAVKETGISAKKLRELAIQGEIDGIKVRNTWLLLRESIEEYLAGSSKP